MRVKPAPRSCCTWPPSWSAATSSPGAAALLQGCRRPGDRGGAAAPPAEEHDATEVLCARRAARRLTLAPLWRPTINSWPARSAGVMPAASRSLARGALVVVVLVDEVEEVVLVEVDGAGAVDVTVVVVGTWAPRRVRRCTLPGGDRERQERDSEEASCGVGALGHRWNLTR